MATLQTTPASSSTPIPALPVLHELKISKDAEEWLKTLSPGIFQNDESIQKAWNAPTTQFSLTLLQDPAFQQASQSISDRHLTSRFVGYELVLILVLWIFRAWRLSKASTWLLRIWAQAWIAVVFWFLGILLVPWLVWGEDYRILVKEVLKAILRHFFA